MRPLLLVLKWRDDILLQPVDNCDTAYYTGLDKDDLHIEPDALDEQLRETPSATDGYMGRLITSLRTDGRVFHHYGNLLRLTHLGEIRKMVPRLAFIRQVISLKKTNDHPHPYPPPTRGRELEVDPSSRGMEREVYPP